MKSLSARLLIAASVVLAAFLGLSGIALDQAFRESELMAVRDRLQAQIYQLLSAAEVGKNGQVTLPEVLPEPRFSTPGSGAYAQVEGAEGNVVWRSRSMLGLRIQFPAAPEPGKAFFAPVKSEDGRPMFALSFAVTWEIGPNTEHRFIFEVAETRSIFASQVSGFRRSLWGWLVGAALVLLLVQTAILQWGLAPLRQVAREIAEVEAGRRRELAEEYPVELRLLTRNINALIRHSQSHLERYRNALGDLAHSLKTPLAVLRGLLEGNAPEGPLRETLHEQVERMDRTVDYQLQRAAASGRTAMTAPLPVRPVVDKIVRSLQKVYAGKGIAFEVAADSNAEFHGDEGDLMEILGNLTDNACKWARSQVSVAARATKGHLGGPHGLELVVEDDGPGIPQDMLSQISERGVRADPQAEGHGIGLAVVSEIVEDVYLGTLQIDSGDLGGARVRVALEF